MLVAAVVAGVAFVLWPSPAPKGASEPQIPAPPPVTEKSDDPAETTQMEAPVELVKIEVDSRPSRAFVALNGDRMGRTPLTLELTPGVEATVRFSLRGYRTQEHRLVPSEDDALVARHVGVSGEEHRHSAKAIAEDDALVARLKQRPRPKPAPIKTDF